MPAARPVLADALDLLARWERGFSDLQAPLILDLRDRTARQVVLQDPRYHTRHPVDLRSRLS